MLVRFYQDGALRKEAQLRDGKLDGSIKYYDKEGNLTSTISL